MTDPYSHVRAAVQALRAAPVLRARGAGAGYSRTEMHRELRQLADTAMDELGIARRRNAPGPAKPWIVVLRFWRLDTEALIGETEPETVRGTGAVPPLAASYARELHGADLETWPDPLPAKQLHALRVGLVKDDSAVMRIRYTAAGAAHLCQVDVTRPPDL